MSSVHMLSREENDLLTRVEGAAPMGQMMRRYWFPVLLASEIAEAGRTPLRVRLLGEDLVAFHDGAENRVASLALEHSFPVLEAGGMIWTCLAPDGAAPPFPRHDWMDLPE